VEIVMKTMTQHFEFVVHFGLDSHDAISALRQLDSIVVLDGNDYVKNVDLTSNPNADVAILHLKKLAHLRMLFLCNTTVSDAELVHLSRLFDLDILDLFHTPTGDHGLHYLRGLHRLTWLNLERTRITDEAIDSLSTLTHLKWLSVRDTQVTAEGVLRLAKALPGVAISHSQDEDG
jgi:hypothetical protein